MPNINEEEIKKELEKLKKEFEAKAIKKKRNDAVIKFLKTPEKLDKQAKQDYKDMELANKEGGPITFGGKKRRTKRTKKAKRTKKSKKTKKTKKTKRTKKTKKSKKTKKKYNPQERLMAAML